MLDTIRSVDIFRYSSKRQVLLGQCILERKKYAAEKGIQEIRLQKFSFYVTYDGLNVMHPFIVFFLLIIQYLKHKVDNGDPSRKWDAKSIAEVNGFLYTICDSSFLFAVNFSNYIFLSMQITFFSSIFFVNPSSY